MFRRGHKQMLVSMRNKSIALSDITQGFNARCFSAAKFRADKSKLTDFCHQEAREKKKRNTTEVH